MRKLGILAAFFLVTACSARAQTFVTGTGGWCHPGGGGTTCVEPSSGINVAAGQLIIGFCSAAASSQTTISFSDTAGDTFTALRSNLSTTPYTEMFYTLNSIANSSEKFTCTFGNSASNMTTSHAIFSGVATSGASDANPTVATGTGTTATTNSFSTTSANEVIFTVGAWDSAGTLGAPSGFTSAFFNGGYTGGTYEIVTATQSGLTPATTNTAGGTWAAYAVSFTAAATATMVKRHGPGVF
jgi:hypothetical protein